MAGLVEWMVSGAANELYGAVVLFVAVRALAKLRIGADLGRKYLGKTLGRPNRMKRFARGVRRRSLVKLRKRRFDLAWIQRQVSRAHVCFMLCILWLGIWVLAMGLMDVLNYTGEPLRRTSTAALLTVFPAYLFEAMWIIYSGSVSQVISHRQTKKIWRYSFAR